jgi:hypothetical protein
MTRELKDVLADLSDLLKAEGYGGPDSYAGDIDAVAARLPERQAEACDRLASLEFWGGMGSLGDVYFCRENLAARKDAEHYASPMVSPHSDFAAANHRFSELLAELSAGFVASCIGATHQEWHERAKLIGSVHRTWVESGVR